MTTYLGEKAVGLGTIKATMNVGKVITDKKTVLGDGFTEPLAVNTLLFATSESVAASAEAIRTEVNNKFTVVDSAIKGANEAIAKTRDDYIQADSEIHQMLNGLSAETTTIKNNQASLGTQVANIEHKIPDGTTGTNSLINKQILAQTSYTKAEVDAKVSSVYKFKGSVSTYNSLPSTATTGDVYNVTDTGANYAWDGSKWDKLSETIDLTAYATTAYVTAREQDIRSDLGGNISEVHTQVVGLSGEVAKKLNSDGDTMTGTLNVPELNVATPEGTLNLSITAGVATIATNNGLDIVSQTKFDKAPTTDDNTTWANALDTSLVSKRQVAAALAESGGGGDYLPLSGGTLTGNLILANKDIRLNIVKEETESGGSFRPLDNGLQLYAVNSWGGLSGDYRFATSSFSAGSTTTLGTTDRPWSKVFAKSLNNGADIAIPTTGGTLARLEDLEGLGGASLPDQTDNAGKFLTTDGTTASWGEALVNKKTEDNNLAILGDITKGNYSVVIGSNAKSASRENVVIGHTAQAWNDISGSSNVIIGYNAKSAGYQSVVIGAGAASTNTTAERVIAIGWAAKAYQDFAIQLGAGVNPDANTFKVGLSGSDNYELLSADGTIPAARHATLPTEDGTYVLKCVISGGVPTMTWVKE